MGYNMGDFKERKMNSFSLTDKNKSSEENIKPKSAIDTRGLFDKTDFTDNVAYNVVDIPIEFLQTDSNNNFRPLTGEKREEVKQSIEEHNIQTPLIVRRKGQKYEIICGNNRKSIAEEIGMKTVPCIIKEVDDYEASILAGIDNMNRREEISDIEKGWAFRRAYEALVKDKDENLKRGNSPSPHEGASGEECDFSSDSPSPHGGASGNEGKTESIIAKDFGVSKNTVFRKMRLTHLVEPMLELFENKKISQEVAVELSYLKPLQQRHSITEIVRYKKISLECAKELHKVAESNPDMGVNEIMDIFAKHNAAEKEKAPKTKSRRYSIADDLFPSYLIDPKEKMEYIEEVLRKALKEQPNLE